MYLGVQLAFLKLYPGVDISQEEDVYPSEYTSMVTYFCAILNIKKGHTN